MTTLSKEQAVAISDAFLAENAQRYSPRNFFVGFVHPIYRFFELSAFQPWQQARIIQAASRLADRQPSVLLVFFLFVVALLSAAFLAPAEYQGALTFPAIFVFVGIPAMLVRRAAVHRYVLALLANR